MGDIPQKKYHVSDDGKVYRINEDGSFTEMGNIEDSFAENKSNEDNASTSMSEQPSKSDYEDEPDYEEGDMSERHSKSKWWIIMLTILSIVGIGAFIFFNGSHNQSYESEVVMVEDTTVSEITAEGAALEVEAKADEGLVKTEDALADTTPVPPFNSYEDRAYYCNAEDGNVEIYFYSNGQCDIFDGENMLDSGCYELDGWYIKFKYFNNWPCEYVYMRDDRSFQYAGLTFWLK